MTHSSPTWAVELAGTSPEAETHLEAWADLARRALEPNAFLEPEYVLPALRHLPSGRERAGVLFVWRVGGSGRELAAVMTVSRSRWTNRLPVSSVGSWQHKHAFLGTPLLDAGCAPGALAAILDWAARAARSGRLMRFEGVAADGPFFRVLEATVAPRRMTITQQLARPLYRRPREAGFEQHYNSLVSGTRRRRYRGLRKQMSALGALEFREVTDPLECARLTAEYLDLESRGWKGEAGTALAIRSAERAFCEDVARGFAARGGFCVLALFSQGRAVAIRISLRSGPASFCFKTSYDPAFRHYSPGVLLEIEQLERMVGDPTLEWSDSCAVSASTPLTWLWADRREIRSLLIPLGGFVGAAATAALPTLRLLGSGLRRLGRNDGALLRGGGQEPSDRARDQP